MSLQIPARADLPPEVRRYLEQNLSRQNTNIGNIATHGGRLDTLEPTVADHIAATADVHGASGEVLGTDDTASAVTRGPVYRAAATADAATTSSASTVSVGSTDAGTMSAAYVQAEAQRTATLADETKGDVNQLVSDLNAVRADLLAVTTAFNALLAALRTSEVLTP